MAKGRVAVLYDFMAVKGGAERVTETLLRCFPSSDLFTGYVNAEAFPNLGSACGRVTSLGRPTKYQLTRLLSTIWAFERCAPRLQDYRWRIFSGSYAPFAARRRSGCRNVLYCHTVPRICADLRSYYMNQVPPWARPLASLFVALLARRYGRALGQMDVVLANSHNVRLRLLDHFGCSATVVYPPISTRDFRWLKHGTDYVSLGRLEPLKRVSVVVEAFRRMPDRRLIVASGGSEMAELTRLAADAPNISFTGWLSEHGLQQLLGGARAALYVPINEDFGMAPVEAMAAGKPVIGVAEGGLLETVVHGETGLLIDGPLTPESICTAVQRLEQWGTAAMRPACERRAALFSEESFVAQMQTLVQDR